MPVRLAVLSRGSHLYATRRLREAARARGHVVEVLDYASVNARFGLGGAVEVDLGGEDLSRFDVALGRVSPLYTPLGVSVLRCLAAAGVRCVPRASALALTRDKFRALLALERAGLPVPPTAMVNDPAHADAERLGGFPLVVKPLTGTHGAGVTLVADAGALAAALLASARARAGVLVQRFVAETGGADVRVLVSGGRVAAAMRRTPRRGDFRSNLHCGGTAAPVELAAEEARLAIAAARALGLAVAGVDLLRSRGGPLVMEVNASPGFEGLERVTGVDVAAAIVTAAVDAHR